MVNQIAQINTSKSPDMTSASIVFSSRDSSCRLLPAIAWQITEHNNPDILLRNSDVARETLIETLKIAISVSYMNV